MPRIDPNTNRGIISDVCIKRKIRNFVEICPPEDTLESGNGFNILVRQGAVLNDEIAKGIAAAKTVPTNDTDDKKAKAAKEWLCCESTMSVLLAVDPPLEKRIMKGSALGQVRGPVQFTFAQSYHPITPLEISITRCAVTKEEDKAKEAHDGPGKHHRPPMPCNSAKCYISLGLRRA